MIPLFRGNLALMQTGTEALQGAIGLSVELSPATR